ncbi:uncharacterized protein BDZ99DRAFT_504018 [Mytilinidion resinicola]|uniref:Uncharacterized protein n=1 Tax=Mytilinidion resinicola TaxID=574789 RepID=A0A6A6Y0U5_9PEZI|nr:uncharacterized protein BDZ99DRAFT_504018 [Mytilinidion resinicola]KAF2802269.1 hypothetical protein BDZ99DRAFT_504018 [Mytilinidion resinicola]
MVSTWTTKKLKGEVTPQTDEMVAEIIDEMKLNWSVDNIGKTIPERFRYIARVPRSNHVRFVNPRRTEEDAARWSYGVLRKLKKLSRCSKGDVAGGLASLSMVVEAQEKHNRAALATGLLGLWPRNFKLAITHYKQTHPEMVNNWAAVCPTDLRDLGHLLGKTYAPLGPIIATEAGSPGCPLTPVDCDSETEDEEDENDDDEEEEDDDEDSDDDDGDGDGDGDGSALSTTATRPFVRNSHVPTSGEQPAENGTATTGALTGSATTVQHRLTHPNAQRDASNPITQSAREESTLFVTGNSPEPETTGRDTTTEPQTSQDQAEPTSVCAQGDGLRLTIRDSTIQNKASLFGDGTDISPSVSPSFKSTTTKPQTTDDKANPTSPAATDGPPSKASIKREPDIKFVSYVKRETKTGPDIKTEPDIDMPIRRKRPAQYVEVIDDDAADEDMWRLRIDLDEAKVKLAESKFQARANQRKRQRRVVPGGWYDPLVLD